MRQENKFTDIFKSPMSVAMLLIGAALVLGVPYWALQTLPGISNPVTGEAPAPKGDPNAGINFQELGTLPDELAQSASVILSQEAPVMPELLLDLPVASGFGLIHPVTEAVETTQPALSWTLFAPGPFKVVVKDKAGDIVVSAPNIPNTAWVLPKKLNPGGTYTWQVTASNNEYQDAAFVVMTTENVAELQRARRDFPQSHLALGLMAEHYGLLGTAEREYQALTREFPSAEAPARLLANVLALRD